MNNTTTLEQSARVITRRMRVSATLPSFGVIAPARHTEWFYVEAEARARADQINEELANLYTGEGEL